MLKYIFSVLLIAAVWTTVLLLELPMWIAIAATAAILVILFTIIIVKVVKAKKAAREIEKALKAQAAAHAANARPDLKADIDAMQAEFLKAVGALKTSKLGGGKRGSEALYALPWYMIIGPPGAGKSTALRNSGLRFPYLSRNGGGVQGVGGTRNCQWWMTNEAVILDTAGRYTTEETDRDEWMSFLDLLKRNRNKQPINGVMVAIALTDLSEAHPEEVLARAREIRARIDEVMAKLEMVVPVYVLFTKCDLLPGFVEMFGDLGNEERNQIWGFTVPVTKKGDPAQQFVQHFGELGQTVERRSMRRIAEERSADARDRIYTFPQYFEPLRNNLAMFVGEVMAESIYTESPIFRGAYFTSGTQEGRPIDRIMNGMAEAFGIQPRMHMTAPQVEAKSYFLGDVFTKVIFPDKNVATRSAARMRRQALVGHGIAAGLFLSAVGLAVLPVMSFDDNRKFVNRTADSLDPVQEHIAANVWQPIKMEQIEPLAGVEAELTLHEDDGAPLLMRMGMYQGNLLRPKVREVFLRVVREELVRPLLKLEIDKLQDFGIRLGPVNEQPSQAEHDEYKARLRMYLLLTGTYAEGEPGLDEEQRTWLSQQIADLWAEPLAMAGDVGSKAAMLSVATRYVDALSREPDYLFERDVKLVERVRKVLVRTDRVDAMLAALLADVEVKDVTVQGLTGSEVIRGDRNIPGAYTRNGWDDYVRERLDQPLDNLIGQEWVLGRTEKEAKEDQDLQMKKLRSLYFENYIKEWKGFLSALYMDFPQDYVAARAAFEDLTRGAEPPLKRLAHNVHWHTELPDAPAPEAEAVDAVGELGKEALAKKGGKGGKAAAGALDKLGKNKGSKDPFEKTQQDVREAFSGFAAFGYAPPAEAPEGSAPPPPPDVPLDRYQEELKKVRDALAAKIDIDGENENKALGNAVRGAITTVDGLLNETDTRGWNTTLQRLLPPPFQTVASLVGKSTGDQLTVAYCERLYKPMHAFLKDYPFATKGREVPMSQFKKFFQPGTGEVWKAYDEILASRITRKHEGFAVQKTGAAVREQVNPQIATFLDAADALSRSLFPPGTEAMGTQFTVRIADNPKTSQTQVTIDGLMVKHLHGPAKDYPMRWPGEGDPKIGKIYTAGLGVQGEIERVGDWGFLRLLEAGTVVGSASNEVFTVRWDLNDQSAGIVKITIRPQEEDTPFFGPRESDFTFLGVFRQPALDPPNTLFVGGKTCATE